MAAAHLTLSEKRFTKLTRELSRILDTATRGASHEKISGYWLMGERIAQERLTQKAGYHSSVLRELADALSLTTRTLQRAVSFHAAYPTPPAESLSWAHYQLLAPLSSKKERAFYSKLAQTEKWSARTLRAAIARDLFSSGRLSQKAATLVRPQPHSFVYQALVVKVIDGDTIDLQLDLGFTTWTKRRIRLALIDCPEEGAPGRAAKNFTADHLMRAKTIAVHTQKTDVHGRYIAYLFVTMTSSTVDECLRSGLYLNELLLQAGHATAVL